MSRSPPKPARTRSRQRAARAGISVEGPGLGEATRGRLINAAGEVFAEVGFREATVRDICTRAGVNVAAVSYYFGDKAGLYAEVLRHTHAAARAKYPLERVGHVEGTGGASADDALRFFVRMFMTKILDEGRPAWHGKLMAREMVEPTRALDEIVESTIRPTWAALTGIVAKLVSREVGDLVVRDCAASVIGQCLMFCHCRPVIDRLFPESRYTPEQIARLSEHIVLFSLAALRDIGDRTRSNRSVEAAPAFEVRVGRSGEPSPRRGRSPMPGRNGGRA